jgi:hypothetical protein
MLSVCRHGALAVRRQEVLAELTALFASFAAVRNCTQTDSKRSMRAAYEHCPAHGDAALAAPQRIRGATDGAHQSAFGPDSRRPRVRLGRRRRRRSKFARRGLPYASARLRAGVRRSNGGAAELVGRRRDGVGCVRLASVWVGNRLGSRRTGAALVCLVAVGCTARRRALRIGAACTGREGCCAFVSSLLGPLGLVGELVHGPCGGLQAKTGLLLVE